MTVTDLDKGKIKITLDDREIIAIFGTYQKLYTMSDSIKPKFEKILEKVLLSRGLSLKDEFLIQVKAKQNVGCVILISPKENRTQKPKEHHFIFENSEALIQGILFLFRNSKTKNLQSKLYKMQSGYCLIIYTKSENPYLLTLNEYCKKKTASPFITEHLKEHGKLLIGKGAIKTLGNYFFKEI